MPLTLVLPQATWTREIKRYVELIDQRFSKYFTDMGCEGRVALGKVTFAKLPLIVLVQRTILTSTVVS